MLKNFVLLLCIMGTFPPVFSQQKLLQSGPMLGYADLREVLLWAQTTEAATVQFEYWQTEKPTLKLRTEAVVTQKTSAYTAKCIAEDLQPGTTYNYNLLINNVVVTLPYPTQFKTQAHWQFRSDPPAFSVATGSCAFVNEAAYDRAGKPYGGDYQIFQRIADQKPDIMLWLGDNTYYREGDWTSRTRMNHRYTHTRSLPELQPLLANTNHYAIWDDHDYGPDDSDGSWIHKETAWAVFRDFWGNPSYGLEDKKGCTTFFQYNDVDFFLLDDRYFRAPDECKTCDRTMIGHEQLEWLIAALSKSRAPFKLVTLGGQIITTNDAFETYAHFFSAERDTILARIERENIKGVVFLTGDRHFTELSAYQNASNNWVYDLTVSPFTSGPVKDAATKCPNAYRIDGTVVDQRNFAILQFSGPRKERQMNIKVFDANGKEQWAKVVNN